MRRPPDGAARLQGSGPDTRALPATERLKIATQSLSRLGCYALTRFGRCLGSRLGFFLFPGVDQAVGRHVIGHQVDGRGNEIGPDLSTIGRTEPQRILESLLQPSATVAPAYQAWTLAMHDGRVLNGILVRTYLDEYTYLDAQGKPFTVKTHDVAETKASATSIMPEGLFNQLTDQEVRDLLAFLFSRK